MFNMFKPKEYKEFLNLITIYDKLIIQKQKTTDQELIPLIDLEMQNASQALGLNFRRWESDENSEDFLKFIFKFIETNFKNNNNSGLPASIEFIRGNELFLDKVISKNEYNMSNESKDLPLFIREEILKINKINKSLNKLHELKRRMTMQPNTGEIKFLFKEEEYFMITSKGFFTKEEIKKIVKKLNKHKETVEEYVQSYSKNTLFFKEELEKEFIKGLNNNNFKNYSFLLHNEDYYLDNKTLKILLENNEKESIDS